MKPSTSFRFVGLRVILHGNCGSLCRHTLRPTEEGTMHQDNMLSREWRDCIDACLRCVQICEECSDDMIGMEQTADMPLMAQCIRLCRECADICAMSARWMSRVSSLAPRLCGLCAEVCEQCADVCERHAPHHALCGPCAEECRRCADMCRRMSGSSAKAA